MKIITCQGYNSCVQRRCRHDKCSRMYNWCKCQDNACLEGANSLANVRRVGLRCPDFDKKKKLENYNVMGNFSAMLKIAALVDKKKFAK